MEEVFGLCHFGDDFAEARSWQLATLQDKKLEDDTPLKLLRQIYACRKLQETIFILGATATFFQDPPFSVSILGWSFMWICFCCSSEMAYFVGQHVSLIQTSTMLGKPIAFCGTFFDFGTTILRHLCWIPWNSIISPDRTSETCCWLLGGCWENMGGILIGRSWLFGVVI